MSNIRVDVNYTIGDGTEIVFRSPVDCSQITGLKVYYPVGDGNTTSKAFALADAHGNNVGDIDHLFAENVVVKVILDVTSGMAFVQNADTNAYIERTFVKSVNGEKPDENGNVTVPDTNEYIERTFVKTVNNTTPDENGNVEVKITDDSPAIVNTMTGQTVVLHDASDRFLPGLTLYGRTTQDGTPSPEAPASLVSPGDSGQISVNVHGKNLLTLPYRDGGIGDVREHNGITYTVNADGSVTAKGTATASSYFRFTGIPQYPMDGDIGEGGTNGRVKLSEKLRGGNTIAIVFGSGDSVDKTYYPQVEPGTVSTSYEMPRTAQSMTVSTPGGLPGIPVESGGNYTDENGQQWICDEVDFARGVYVQRINALVFDGTESWEIYTDYPHLFTHVTSHPAQLNKTPVLCSHFPYDPDGLMEGKDGCRFAVGSYTNEIYRLYISSSIHTDVGTFKTWLAERAAAGDPVTMYYALYTPVETALSEELLAAFAQLHSCKPNTTVYNDAGADMAVQYVADTKTYVDDLYEELAEAILNGGGGSTDLTGYATEQWVTEGFQPKGDYLTEVPEGYAKSEEIPKSPEDIGAQPAGDYLTNAPVESVNGKTGAVSLSAVDVGALPSTYTPPDQTAEQVGADPKGTAASAVSEHNTSTDSHNDLRIELKALSDRLTAFFDSDDQTLDELSEIVAYITSNKALIDSITTSKVSVADIVDNLTTNVSNKPLSAAQGVVLKGLIDTLSNSLANYQPKGDYALRSELPTKVSQLTNDAGYLTLDTLPVYNGEVQ